jgi:hypothetical protein
MRYPHLPFEIIVSRLLSNPYESAFHLSLTLLNPLSDLDLYLALDEEYHPYSHYTLKQCYYASKYQGATRVALCGLACSTALCPNDDARPQLEFRPGISLFARRYWRNLILISFPRLTDMLKFGLWSRTTQVAFLFSTEAGMPPAQLDQLCIVRGLNVLRYSRIDNSHRAEARRHKYRSVLRSSSMSKPRDPLLLVKIFV